MDTHESNLPGLSKFVRVVPFYGKRDYPLFCSWWRERGQSAPLKEDLPLFGLTALFDGFPIAMGFLRKCEGHYAIFDSLVTDPEGSSHDRHVALEILVPEIIKEAKKQRFKILFGITSKNDVILRSKKYGFIESRFRLISLGL